MYVTCNIVLAWYISFDVYDEYIRHKKMVFFYLMSSILVM